MHAAVRRSHGNGVPAFAFAVVLSGRVSAYLLFTPASLRRANPSGCYSPWSQR